MEKTRKLFHRFAFALWFFSHVHPYLGGILRYSAKCITKNFSGNYKNKMRSMGNSLFPAERYERTPEISCQFVLLSGDKATSDDIKGTEILMNHMRIPYHRWTLEQLKKFTQEIDDQPLVIIVTGSSHPQMRDVLTILNKKKARIVAFYSDAAFPTADKRITCLRGDPAEFLPYNSGLRSSLAKDFVLSLLNLDFPVITGFLPPQVGLRIDDVAGVGSREYLTSLTEKGWVPNLGIFIDDFNDCASDCGGLISSLATSEKIETSPHAFSADKFIYYNYKKGEPFSIDELNNIWKNVLYLFRKWKFPISPVLNSHFHAFSLKNKELLLKNGIKYAFSELAPDDIAPNPDPRYLPSGDPLHTTGQIEGQGFMQIYSGDTLQCCNIKDSLYDFLMHNRREEIIPDAIDRIYRRLELSLRTGFAAFVTTHEYLLNRLTQKEISDIFDGVDRLFAGDPFYPVKASLSRIGCACENHTNIVIHSVKLKNDKYTIKLTGEARSQSKLSVFQEKRLKFIDIPPFSKEYILEGGL